MWYAPGDLCADSYFNTCYDPITNMNYVTCDRAGGAKSNPFTIEYACRQLPDPRFTKRCSPDVYRDHIIVDRRYR